ncbi:MAG TPA: hypothetical protein VIL18_01350 [Longimicrobiales bacterium]
MFQELKDAWREAVENFRRELAGGPGAPARDRIRAMQEDLSVAASALERIERDIAAAHREAATAREEEAVCRRREAMARNIGDTETAAIAERFAARHAERAAILERKAAVLEAERDLLRRELAEMERILEERKREAGASGDGPASAGAAAGARHDASRGGIAMDDAADAEFRRLERKERERRAEAMLEELKRRMR